MLMSSFMHYISNLTMQHWIPLMMHRPVKMVIMMHDHVDGSMILHKKQRLAHVIIIWLTL